MSVANVDVEGRSLVVSFQYDQQLVDIVRALPSRRYDASSKCWRAPITPANIKRIGHLAQHGRFLLSPAAQQVVTGSVVNAETLTFTGGNTMSVHLPNTRSVQEMIAPLFGTYEYKNRQWSVRLAPHSIDGLARLIDQKKLNASAEARAELARRMPEAAAQLALYRDLRERSAAAASDLHIDGLGGDLRPYQKAGVAYAAETRRCMIADQMGLGKTISALATAQAAGTFPLVVVCPAIVKYNWEREARKWLPGKQVEVLSGTKTPDSLPMVLPDVWIVNYDVLHAWEPWLAACSPRGLIADESHYAKNGKARRTKALKSLSGAIPQDGIVVLLTGTPVLNRPEELISQLEVIDRMADLGGKKYFLSRYVDFNGKARNEIELHRRMRATFYVRREKSEVLTELPEKERATVLLDVKLGKAYAEVKKDVVDWLRENKENPKVTEATQRAKLDTLKSAITDAKLPVAIDWIKGFLESGEKLVVFAYHIAVQNALVEAFPDCAHVLGADKHEDRQRSVDDFQSEDGPQLIVCSLKAAGVGITLTAASDVAFVEMGWTPADQDQAEDRCHRMGQYDSVTAHYLLARGTEDVDIAERIDAKRQITTAITEGREVEEEESIVSEMVAKLLREGA